MAQTQSHLVTSLHRGTDSGLPSVLNNAGVVGDWGREIVRSAVQSIVMEQMARLANENGSSPSTARRNSYGSNTSSTSTEPKMCSQDEDTSETRKGTSDSQESDSSGPVSARHPSSGRGLLKKRKRLLDEAQNHEKVAKLDCQQDHPETVESSSREIQEQDENSTNLAPDENNVASVSAARKSALQVDHGSAAGVDSADESVRDEAETNPISDHGGENVDEKTRQRELMQQERSKRKRFREKQRRSDVNKGFDDLTSLLKKIDPAAAGAEGSNQEGGATGTSTPPNRVVLISRTVNILERLYNENMELKQTVQMLRQVRQGPSQIGWAADERFRAATALGAQQGNIFQGANGMLQQGRRDEATLLVPVMIPYDTPLQQTASGFLPLSHVARDSVFPSVDGGNVRGTLHDALVRYASQQQQVPASDTTLPSANRSPAQPRDANSTLLLNQNDQSQQASPGQQQHGTARWPGAHSSK